MTIKAVLCWVLAHEWKVVSDEWGLSYTYCRRCRQQQPAPEEP